MEKLVEQINAEDKLRVYEWNSIIDWLEEEELGGKKYVKYVVHQERVDFLLYGKNGKVIKRYRFEDEGKGFDEAKRVLGRIIMNIRIEMGEYWKEISYVTYQPYC